MKRLRTTASCYDTYVPLHSDDWFLSGCSFETIFFNGWILKNMLFEWEV